ncbi:DUF5107 domain-containing protein [Enterobacillus tribolii]|uniref:Tetratricopeptide repeat protein n=1 Tax=Enterobacillus tribolii TaxID=1487935 RepID=A0A370QN79_9GAMM|nr:DUF5107 domain-containing protein [Enterobacillus tribolii]MBW7982172.1 DUF5107 domain-containing protein [Enterobacillus tribolii]RDK89806.1 tetratricopeptide repeat protein [Enterobacillus tribolii]
MYGEVKVWQEKITLPTYLTGAEDPNPMFLEKRVYQGSSGAVYPYGVIDTLTGECVDRDYQAVWMENDFIRIMLLPELGGRIQRAYDKVMQRDFVYYNEVVKPALVGLVGPWISGGIEFNWPQHHRPTTFMPVDVTFRTHDDGAQTVWLGEVEPMRGLQVMTGFTLYPDKALIEITGKVFNGNATPRHFLWWANPAVKGGDDHQSVFPPDVTAVYDHGKRDVSAFPIATGTYYKVDYSAGVDISRYKNVPVPTSYMADKSNYDFVGAYHHGEEGGLLHVADHHISPGKKQWTWGNCDFGLAWDRNLTDNNGPYIELMTGVFTDNQPDFTWLAPYEEKVFVQNFLPYSRLGTLQNANTRVAVKLERENDRLSLGVYAIAPLEAATLLLENAAGQVFQESITLAPAQVWQRRIADNSADRLTLRIVDGEGQEVILYQEHIPQDVPLPDAATAPAKPEALTCCDELYFIGQHLEQYLHASRSPFDYYLRALELDPQDYRCNVALATLEYNRGDYEKTRRYADAALQRAHRWNKNPQNGQASLLRASANERSGHYDDAYDDYFKASWSGDCRDAAFYGLARLALRKGDAAQALAFVRQSLTFNGANNLAMGLQALCLHRLGQHEEAQAWLERCLKAYPLSYVLYYARYAITGSQPDEQELKRVTNDRGMNACVLAGWLLSFGQCREAADLLTLLDNQETLPLLFRAALEKDAALRAPLLVQAKQNFHLRVRFPNTLDEVDILRRLPDDGFAQYLLGCFFYSKRDYAQALACWQTTKEKLPDFAGVWRVLGIHAYNKLHDEALAESHLRQALALEPENPRLLFELDCLHKLRGTAPESRLQLLLERRDTALRRDDLTAELLSLLHIAGETAVAAEILQRRQFHPWEGGEGKVTGQYLINRQRRALALMAEGRYDAAVTLLDEALHYPLNLGEGRLVGQTDNDIWYLLAVCALRLGDRQRADDCLKQALRGEDSLSAGRYYNDQPVDYPFYQVMAMKLCGKDAAARQRSEAMVAWARQHRDDPVDADFFAVSLPDLIALDASPAERYQQHCLFVEALGLLGLDDAAGFRQTLDELLRRNPAHDKAHLIRLAQQAGVFKH